MRILKFILFLIIGIVGLLLIAGLFIKKDYAVEREIVINKPKQQVYDYIKFLKNQDNYSKWATMDPNMKKEYKGTDATVGFISAWDSKMDNVGKGEQEIKKMDEGNRIDYELRFIEPFSSKSDAYLSLSAENENATKVKWGFTGKWNYPMNVMSLFMNMDKEVGGDFEIGLTNLKNLLEKS